MTEQPVKVWDPTLRLFHWSLILLIGFSWLSAELGGNWMIWHTQSGFLIAGLLIYRLLWGFFGPWSARFSTFVVGLGALINYLKQPEDRIYLSHNPAGGLGTVLILGLVTAQVTTGLFSTDDIFIDGPLAFLIPYEWQLNAASVHETLFNGLLAFAVLHLIAIGYHQWFKGEQLIQAMVHGKKNAPTGEARPLSISLPVLLVCAGSGILVSSLLWIYG